MGSLISGYWLLLFDAVGHSRARMVQDYNYQRANGIVLVYSVTNEVGWAAWVETQYDHFEC